MKKILIQSARGPYPVVLTSRFENLDPSLGKYWNWNHVLLIADRKMKTRAQAWVERLNHTGLHAELHLVRGDESIKNLRSIESLYRTLIKYEVDRYSVVIAMGGGAVGDAVGFLAATYMRGIAWINIPTTLLAQVDSSIGGKTAINLEWPGGRGKNLVGAFHPPSMVLCDQSFLKTLPLREVCSGLGEIIKTAMISDAKWFAQIAQVLERGLEETDLSGWIEKSLKFKKFCVEQDERDENGIREVLNFGHNIAHALESLTAFKDFRHGEAVILGLRVEAALSVVKGLMGLDEFEWIDAVLGQVPVTKVQRKIRARELLLALYCDKKNRDGEMHFVLLEGLGRPVPGCTVTADELSAALLLTPALPIQR